MISDHKVSISLNSILLIIVLAVLIAALPTAIWRVIRTGDPYLFTERFFIDVLARLSGPGKLRFVVQPIVAIVLAVRGGKKDAEAGLPPFLLALVFHREQRRELLQHAFSSICNLLAIAVLLDLISQFLIFREVRPGAALVVGPVLIVVPYSICRAFSAPIWKWWIHAREIK